jgi:AraC family transcriptional regulator, regulatory protein of adaptative response / methylated-DNA-[protein]-cysteine methyltransferase
MKHDLIVTCEAMTPGTRKTREQGLAIRYGVHPTIFGHCLLALTDKGICALQFVDSAGARKEIAELAAEWRGANLIEDKEKTAKFCQRIFSRQTGKASFHLHLRGTHFQLKVWRALMSVPEGKLVSYSDIATAIHCPKSPRAVGTAIGKNPIGYLIPCHRVIHRSGTLGNYRWGVARKQALIDWEASVAKARN